MLILQDWACSKNFSFQQFLETHVHRNNNSAGSGHLSGNLLVCPRFLWEIGTNGNGTNQRVEKQYQCTPSPGYTTVRGTFAWGPFVSAYILSRRTTNPSTSPLQHLPISHGIALALQRTKTRGEGHAKIFAFQQSTILEPHSTSRTTRVRDKFAPACIFSRRTTNQSVRLLQDEQHFPISHGLALTLCRTKPRAEGSTRRGISER